MDLYVGAFLYSSALYYGYSCGFDPIITAKICFEEDRLEWKNTGKILFQSVVGVRIAESRCLLSQSALKEADMMNMIGPIGMLPFVEWLQDVPFKIDLGFLTSFTC